MISRYTGRATCSYKTAMHSISTSVPSGNCFAATQLGSSVSVSDHVICSLPIRSARFHIPPVLGVDFVHLRKVGHIGQEDVDFDRVVDSGTCGLQDRGEILDALVLRLVSGITLRWVFRSLLTVCA